MSIFSRKISPLLAWRASLTAWLCVAVFSLVWTPRLPQAHADLALTPSGLPGEELSTEEKADFAEHLKVADRAAGVGDWGRTLLELDAALELIPGNPVTRRRAALAHAAGGNWRDGTKHWQFLDTIHSAQAPDYIAWGQAECLHGQAEEAIRLLDQALRIKPGDLDGRLFKAAAQLYLDENADAESSLGLLALKDVTYLARRLAKQDRTLGEALGASRYSRLALLVLTGQTEHRPEDWSGSMDEVAEQLNQAAVGLHRAARNLDAGLATEAVRYSEQAAEAGVTRRVLELFMARALVRAGRAEDGLALLDNLRAKDPDSLLVQYEQGLVQLDAGAYGAAEATLRRVAGQAPKRGDVRFALICAMAGMGQVERACAMLAELPDGVRHALVPAIKGDAVHLQALRRAEGFEEWMKPEWFTDRPAPAATEPP